MSYLYTTQKQIRSAFWFEHSTANRKKYRGNYCTDTRVSFNDFVESIYQSGFISLAMCYKVTLK